MATPKKTSKTASKKEAPRSPMLPKPTTEDRTFARTKMVKVGELHPGQTAEHRSMDDRSGPQLERERHQHPASSIPRAGSERSKKNPKGNGRVPQTKAKK